MIDWQAKRYLRLIANLHIKFLYSENLLSYNIEDNQTNYNYY